MTHTQTRDGRIDPVAAAPVNERPSERTEVPISIIPPHLLTVFMHLFKNICKTPISPLPLPTSPSLDAAISQSLGICAATCLAQCVALEETVLPSALLV